MLSLKLYQERALEALGYYLKLVVQLGDADTAFYTTTKDLAGRGIPYRAVSQLPGLPYVCLRIPTGGGKTLMACHAVGIATRDLAQADRSVVLWLVPTDAIREQTLAALRDRTHPYRQALEAMGTGGVSVMDLTEALYIQRGTLDGSTCIIVATLAALRVERTEGRKIYESAGALQHHFTGLNGSLEEVLEQEPGGNISYSLANVLRLRRPVVIMDEAHNARTPLSFDTLARFNPSCIIELTATPETTHRPESGYFASNVLWHVSAAELKAESMIKLPIRLRTVSAWKEAINEAIQLRTKLNRAAREEEKLTNEYIRPIVLLQAQPTFKDRESTNVEAVRRALQDDFGVPAEQIAVATGEQRDLEDVNLFDRACPINYIITVQALKEGWDCSFAYVLCTMADLSAKTAVEQLLGRIMRLPQASVKRDPLLNQAYAIAASHRFADAANALTDALVQSGFERYEAATLVTPPDQSMLPVSVFARASQVVTEKPDLAKLAPELREKVVYDEEEQRLFVTDPLSNSEQEALERCFVTPAARLAVARMGEESRQGLAKLAVKDKPPVERGEKLSVPYLALRVNGLLELFEESRFVGAQWKLAECDPYLSEAEFSPREPQGMNAQIDVTEQGKLQVRFVESLHRQMELLGEDQGWTVERLANWLDRQIPHPDVTITQATLFLHRLVTQLIERRGFGLEELINQKFRLRDAAIAKIQQHRQAARVQAYQQLLVDGPIEVDPSFTFTYPAIYPANWYYEGKYQFQRHYYPLVGELRSEGEEFACAQFLDTLPKVRYWVRNLERRHTDSVWLQTATDRFYPDFVACLEDGRMLVVEYKGLHLWDSEDSKEKRMLGALWQDRSAGQVIFCMVNDRNMRQVLSDIAG